MQSTFKLGDLAELVAAKLDHPAPALRFYYRGYPMEKYDRTLAQYNVTVDGVLWFIFLPMGYRLARQFALGDGELPHLSNIYKHFQRAGYLRTADALNIVRRATNIMKQEPNGLVVQVWSIGFGRLGCLVGVLAGRRGGSFPSPLLACFRRAVVSLFGVRVDDVIFLLRRGRMVFLFQCN